MSTKTITKRVALATVVALGAGVLSLVSVTSAHATANGTVGASNAGSAAGTLNVATMASPTGSASVDITSAGANLNSVGLLALTDTVAGTTQTATLLNSGALTVYTTGAAGGTYSASIYVTGGTIINASAAPATSKQRLNSAGTALTLSDSATILAAALKPNAGVSSMTVQLYTTTTAALAAANASPTSGTLIGQITVSIATTAVSGVVSVTNSGISYTDGHETDAVTADATSDTYAPSMGTSNYKTVQYGNVYIRDAYKSKVKASGILVASASNGAYVSWSPSGTAANTAASAGTQTAAYLATTSAGEGYGATFTVGNPGTGPLTTTITVSYNGVVIGTKAYTFTGDVAKVVLSAPGNGKTSGSTAVTGNSVTLAFADSAGNAIYPDASSAYPQYLTSNSNNTKGTGLAYGSVSVWPTSTLSGVVLYSCSGINSTGSLGVDYTTASGVVISSNTVSVSCSGAPVAYTAKFDKASYASGDIATLTVTFKDSQGQLAADLAAGQIGAITDGTTTTSANVPAITGSQLTAVNAPTKAESTANGIATYKFIVGTTAGSYQAVVDFPRVDSATQAAVSASYKIADAGGTSLNDVLKGIVSLIASINKQIAALAKLVTKK
jgi:hypothetical protein